MEADASGLIKTISESSKSAVPKAPMTNSLWSKFGATPLANDSIILVKTKSTMTPVPIGGAEAIFSAILADISSSDRLTLSATPPESSIATCCAIALSQASCP